MITLRSMLWFYLSYLIGVVESTHVDVGRGIRYITKSRRSEEMGTIEFEMDKIAKYQLTYSDDSPPKSLSPFIVVLFETDGLLPLFPSLQSVQGALEDFIEAELDKVFKPNHKVFFAQASVLSQKSTVSTRRFRALQTTGSELEIRVNVTFENEPSPETIAVENALKVAMTNMTNFLGNLAVRAINDRELENVHSAFRYEIESEGETSMDNENSNPNSRDPTGVEGSIVENRERSDVRVIVPIVCAVCVATLLAASLIVRRKATPIVPMESGSSDPSLPGVDVFWDEESDIFSFEAALIDSPTIGYSRKQGSPETNGSQSTSTGSFFSSLGKHLFRTHAKKDVGNRDVFSVITGEYRDEPIYSVGQSVHQVHRSPIYQHSPESRTRNDENSDIFSGVNSYDDSRYSKPPTPPSRPNIKANSSHASTVVVSNKARDKDNEGSPSAGNASTPRSGVSSLFTFSEETHDSDLLRSSSDEAKRHDEGDRLNAHYISSDGETNGVGTSQSDDTGNDNHSFLKNHPDGDVNNDQFRIQKGSNSKYWVDQATKARLSPSNTLTSHSLDQSSRYSAPSDEATPTSMLARSEMMPEGILHAPIMTTDQGILQQQLSSSSVSEQKVGYSCGASFPKVFHRTSKPQNQLTSSNAMGEQPSPYSEESEDRKSDSLSIERQDFTADPTYPFKMMKKGNHIQQYSKNMANSKKMNINTSPWAVTLKPVKKIPQPIDTSPSASPEIVTRPLSTGRKKIANRTRHGHRDLTDGYLSDPGPNKMKKLSKKRKKKVELVWHDGTESAVARARRHAKSTLADGTMNYQTETMDPQDWSLTSSDDLVSCGSSYIPDIHPTPRRTLQAKAIQRSSLQNKIESRMKVGEESHLSHLIRCDSRSPGSSTVSGLSVGSNTITDDQQSRMEARTSKKLISDLVWLEKKIAATNNTVVSSPDSTEVGCPTTSGKKIKTKERRHSIDSLSFRSSGESYAGSVDSTVELGSPNATSAFRSSESLKGLQTILCRDCFAPPGKLKIVIHSTKDGPAVHTVKDGSSLKGHIFPGDLIISVDGVDTRSYTAEQVMKMMTARSKYERKITVLHFEEGAEL